MNMEKEQYNKDYPSDEYFLKRGYEKYSRSPIDNGTVECLFQKRFDDDKGKKYFITIKKWDWHWAKDSMGDAPLITYEYHTQLYKKDTHDAVNIDWHSSWNLDDVEKMAEDLWQTGWFDYYEEWELG